jgi:serine/threonine protein kinase
MKDDLTADLHATAVIAEGPDGGLLPGMPIGDEFADVALPGCQFISVLGHGGMGVVFLAKQERLDRFVAVKMLPASLAAHRDHFERLEREALTLANLSHPNIVSCFDIVTTETGTFMIMEYVPGQLSVRDLMLRFGPIPERIVVRIALDVVRGLAYAYEKTVTHHDIKPDNLLVHREEIGPPKSVDSLFDDPHVRVMICDFGIARWKVGAVEDRGPNESDSRRILGSPAYMAPEQAFAPDKIDFRADIYSLASTLYHLLTNVRPFTGETPIDTVRLKVDSDLPDPRSTGVGVTDEFRHILRNMGAAHPDDRYRTYQDLLADVEELYAQWERRPRRRIGSRYPVSFWRGIAVGTAIAVLILGIAGGVRLRRLFTPIPVSRAASLGYWSGERSVWRVLPPDAETSAPVLNGLPSQEPLLLTQELGPGEAVHFSVRLPSRGVLTCGLYETDTPRWEMQWARDALLNGRVTVNADGRDIPIVEIPERKPLQWMAVDLRIREKQVDLVVDGRLTGVAPLRKPLTSCTFGVHIVSGRLAQIKDVWVRIDRP